MTIKEIYDLEKSLKKMVKKIKNDIMNELKAQINPDYQPINSFCGIVKFSTLSKNQNWLPEYYIPERQAYLVEKYLDKTETISGLTTKIKDLIDNKSAKYNNNVYKLNPITIKVLEKYYKGDQI